MPRWAQLAGPSLLVAGITVFGVWWFVSADRRPAAPAREAEATAAPERLVYIPAGAGLRAIAARLEAAGLVRHRWLFMAAAVLAGQHRALRPGEYALRPGMPLRAMVGALVEGRVVTHRVTIPEGFTARQIAALLAREGLADEGRFLALVADPDFARGAGLDAAGLEGFLFPDTYLLTRGLREEEILGQMLARFRQVFGEAEAARARELGLSVTAAVTLASIVEREAKRAEERPLVSAVFHNRLRRAMPLQADPTVLYPAAARRIRRLDLRAATPYNTYIIGGLPPGPIANPGRAALEAALYPAAADYLYFVARNDGSHAFSRTLREHARAVRRHQLARRAE
jgi:UPF0755 protein